MREVQIDALRQLLTKLYTPDGRERCGFITKSALIEVVNAHPDPENGIDISPADIVAHADSAVATWHTHPGAPSNLSGDDYLCFTLQWPDLLHFIVGADGVRCYKYDENKAALMEV